MLTEMRVAFIFEIQSTDDAKGDAASTNYFVATIRLDDAGLHTVERRLRWSKEINEFS